MRDHGGNMDWAMATYGGDAAQWIDLSTGINRVPYLVPELPPEVWTMLPTRTATEALIAAAAVHYGITAPVLVTAGAQAAIQMMPWLAGGQGLARVISPTYNEHAAVLRQAGWRVEEVSGLADVAEADLAVVVNPNNPDGKTYAPTDLAGMIRRVGRLVVDESFGDVTPEVSMLPHAGHPGLIVLRSFGKFWGLAGARLGLIYGCAEDIDVLRGMAGPWPVAGAALEIGHRAYADRDWADATRARLASEVPRIDDLARRAGWAVEGGTALFRLYATPDARQAQDRLARTQIWSRIFPWHPHWLRLGLPGSEAEWARLAAVLET